MTKKRRNSAPPVTIPESLAERIARRIETMAAAGADDNDVKAEILHMLNAAGIDAGRVYAMSRVGRPVTPAVYARLSPENRQRWDTLVAEGRQQFKRIAPLDDEALEIIRAQEQAFLDKFGRPMGPNDPIFFDPTADTPQFMNAEVIEQGMSEAMHKAGVDPALIYAMQRTGFIVTAHNREQMSPTDRREWNASVKEGQRLYPDWKPPRGPTQPRKGKGAA
jgi:hypothetical protein